MKILLSIIFVTLFLASCASVKPGPVDSGVEEKHSNVLKTGKKLFKNNF